MAGHQPVLVESFGLQVCDFAAFQLHTGIPVGSRVVAQVHTTHNGAFAIGNKQFNVVNIGQFAGVAHNLNGQAFFLQALAVVVHALVVNFAREDGATAFVIFGFNVAV